MKYMLTCFGWITLLNGIQQTSITHHFLQELSRHYSACDSDSESSLTPLGSFVAAIPGVKINLEESNEKHSTWHLSVADNDIQESFLKTELIRIAREKMKEHHSGSSEEEIMSRCQRFAYHICCLYSPRIYKAQRDKRQRDSSEALTTRIFNIDECTNMYIPHTSSQEPVYTFKTTVATSDLDRYARPNVFYLEQLTTLAIHDDSPQASPVDKNHEDIESTYDIIQASDWQ